MGIDMHHVGRRVDLDGEIRFVARAVDQALVQAGIKREDAVS